MFSGNLKLAWFNLRQSKWRSFFTTAGIIIGVSSVIIFVSLGQGLKNQIVGQINQMGPDVVTVRSGRIVNRGQAGQISGLNLLAFFTAGTLTDQDQAKISALPSVKTAVPMTLVTNSVQADGHRLDNAFVIGTGPDLLSVLNQKLAYGAFLSSDALDQNAAVIGQNVAHNLFHELNPVGSSFDILGSSFIVRGVLAPSSGGLLSAAQTDFNSAVFVPTAAARQLAGGRGQILQILAKSQGSLDKTVADIHKALLDSHSGQEDFTILKQNELLDVAGSLVNVVTGFISSIAAISLLVGGIGIMNILLVSVTERTREIGIRKAIGATNRQILRQFLAEGTVITLVGGVIGVIVALLADLLLRLFTGLKPAITVPIVLLAVGVSVAVGITFSTLPALKAARKTPIEALRNE